MKKKYSLALLVICCSLLLFAGCGKRKSNEDQWTRINEEKRIIIGLDDSFVPMGFQDKSGKIVGFDVDLAKAVFKLYGISVDFQPIDWSMKETELQNQTIDLIWNGYTKTSERAEKVQLHDERSSTCFFKSKKHCNSERHARQNFRGSKRLFWL